MKLHICDNCKGSFKTQKITFSVEGGYHESRDWCKACRDALLTREFRKLADRHKDYQPEYLIRTSYLEYR
jgi:hypothetical protein